MQKDHHQMLSDRQRRPFFPFFRFLIISSMDSRRSAFGHSSIQRRPRSRNQESILQKEDKEEKYSAGCVCMHVVK
jgi:hypothetical protein